MFLSYTCRKSLCIVFLFQFYQLVGALDYFNKFHIWDVIRKVTVVVYRPAVAKTCAEMKSTAVRFETDEAGGCVQLAHHCAHHSGGPHYSSVRRRWPGRSVRFWNFIQLEYSTREGGCGRTTTELVVSRTALSLGQMGHEEAFQADLNPPPTYICKSGTVIERGLRNVVADEK